MNKKINKKNLYDFIFLLLISLTIMFLFSIDHLNEDNCNYAVEEIHYFNNEIFKGNISTIGMEFSPRYYANMFMAFLIKFFNSDWYEVSFGLIKINYILYALVTTIIAIKFFKKNRLVVGVIMSLCFMTPSLISIAFGLNFALDVFLGTAAPLSFLALICVLGEKKYWLIAWGLAIISTFLHIHEGFWAAFFLGIIWIATCFADKKINFRVLSYILIYLFFLLLVVFSTLTNQIYVDKDYFTQIYVYIRTPHHLLLSYIGKWEIIKSTILLLFIALILFFNIFKYKKYKNIKRIIFSIYFLSISYILLYGVHYFSTEILKIPFIITMYIPKSFRFFTFLGIINCIILGMRKIKKGMYLKGTILLIIPLIPDLSTNNSNYYIVLTLLILFFILEKFKPKGLIIKNRYYREIAKFFVYLFIFLLIYERYFYLFDNLKLLYIGILLYEFIYPYIKNIKIKSIILTIVLILFISAFYNSMKGKVFNVTKDGYQCISGLEYAQKATDLELYELAVQFKNITNLDEGFLADPYAVYPNYFQLFSERNCYVLYKNTPSQKHLVIEWYEKIEKVKNVSEANAEELKELLKDINLKYILLSADKFDVVKDSPYFDEIIKNNKYGIFRLKENIE
ncbi:hypothetical protein LH399_04270 [Fusobacterium nucleatum]